MISFLWTISIVLFSSSHSNSNFPSEFSLRTGISNDTIPFKNYRVSFMVEKTKEPKQNICKTDDLYLLALCGRSQSLSVCTVLFRLNSSRFHPLGIALIKNTLIFILRLLALANSYEARVCLKLETSCCTISTPNLPLLQIK